MLAREFIYIAQLFMDDEVNIILVITLNIMHSIILKFITTLVCLLLSVNISCAETQSVIFTNVPQVTEQKLTPNYWLQQLKKNTGSSDTLLLTHEQIKAFNHAQYQSERYLKDPLSYPEKLEASIIKGMINEISKPALAPRFYENKQQLSASDYLKYIDEMALDTIDNHQRIEFALVTQRASLRTFPTHDRVFKKDLNTDLDRFQESAVFPGEAVAILHYSANKKWVFVQNYHYRAWVESQAIAVGDKTKIADYMLRSNRLIVTGAKVFTTYNPEKAQVSSLQLDMGVNLPIISHQSFAQYQLDRQNPYASHVVLMPTRSKNGSLVLVPALIAKSADVRVSYLPFTRENLIKQSFKFLGERYGWGHDFNGRDCSGFIGEIFKTFGLHMPRNANQQGYGEIGGNTRFTRHDTEALKHAALKQLSVGDLIYLSGHVAMVLGYDDLEQPFIIHDVYGLQYQGANGAMVEGVLNGVSVTPILPFTHYISTMYNIQRLGK